MRALAVLCVCLLGAAGASAQVMADPEAVGAVTVTVLDVKGKPAQGLTIAGLWSAGGYMGDGDRETMFPVGPTWETGPYGKVRVEVHRRRGPYASGESLTVLMTYDESQEHAAIAVLRGKTPGNRVTLRLEPVVKVRGRYLWPTLKQAPRFANGYVFAFTPDGKEGVRIATAPTYDGLFRLKLPPGRYRQNCFGEEVELLTLELDLTVGLPVVDLGWVKLEASGIARAYGKEPPLWWVKEARGVSAEVTAEDYRGRWLLVVYWAFW